MSWLERVLEERLARAAATGELAAPGLEGKPIPDLHRARPQGWWADRFVERELSHDRRRVAEEAAGLARVAFWHAPDAPTVRRLVGDANAAIARANVNLVAADRLAHFDPDDVVDRWRRLRTRRT
jgi:hypothetical protein